MIIKLHWKDKSNFEKSKKLRKRENFIIPFLLGVISFSWFEDFRMHLNNLICVLLEVNLFLELNNGQIQCSVK